MVFPWLSIISGNMDAIIKVKATVFPQFRSVFSYLQSVLGVLERKFIKIKENSIFHGVALIFHTLKIIF